MKYRVVKHHSDFKSQIIELQTHLWSPDLSVNKAYLDWKYERNPYIDTQLIYLVLHEGDVVGMRGIYGAKWQIGKPSQTFLCFCAGDLVIAPDHRNRGLYTKIMREVFDDLVERGHTYILNLSASPINIVSSLAMGWRSTGSLQLMVRESSQKTITPAVEDPFYMMDRNSEKGKFEVIPQISIGKTPRPEAMAGLVERTASNGRIRHARDQEYFAWRFQNPLSQYRFLFWEDGRLEGYLVLQSSIYRDILKVNIVDWEATNFEVRADLLRTAIISGDFKVLSIWSATLSDEEKGLLKNSGFNVLNDAKSIRYGRHTVLVRAVRDNMLKTDWTVAGRSLLNLTNWDLRMIYSDGY